MQSCVQGGFKLKVFHKKYTQLFVWIAAAEANWLSAHRVSGPPSTVLEHYGIAAHMSCTSDTSIGPGGGVQGDTETLCGEGVDLTQTHKLGTDILYLQ